MSEHTRRQVAATRRGDRSLRVNRSGDWLQQPVADTLQRQTTLFVLVWRIFVKMAVHTHNASCVRLYT